MRKKLHYETVVTNFVIKFDIKEIFNYMSHIICMMYVFIWEHLKTGVIYLISLCKAIFSATFCTFGLFFMVMIKKIACPYFSHYLWYHPLHQNTNVHMCCDLAGSVGSRQGSIDCEKKPEKGMHFYWFLLF